MGCSGPDRVIRKEIIVGASPNTVWNAWTTEEGVESFFAPACQVELRVDGPYEILFDPQAEPGQRGAEGTRVLAFQPAKMLAFTWNAPPHLPEVRKQLTHVQVWLEGVEGGRTRVTLLHRGWGEDGEWEQAYEYFSRAWGKVVLPRLRYRFAEGPVDWENPPSFDEG